MKLTTGQKAHRTLTFLSGAMTPEAARALSEFGFGQEQADEGRELVTTVRELSLGQEATPASPMVHEHVDTWENKWLRVADIALSRHYPAVHAYVFSNIARTDGLEVIFSVGEFVSRLRNLETDEVPDGKAARQLLAERGLTDAVVAEAQDLLDRNFTVKKDDGHDRALLEAEDAMWAWYLEWGGLARLAIKNRRVLRRLGFLRKRSKSRPDDLTDAEVFGEEPSSGGDSVDVTEAEQAAPPEASSPVATEPPEASSPVATEPPPDSAERDTVAA